MVHRAHDRDRAAPDLRQARALAVPNAGRVVYKSAAGEWVQSRGGLCVVDRWSTVALSVVQMVRRCEGAAKRLVAVLLVRKSNDNLSRSLCRAINPRSGESADHSHCGLQTSPSIP